MKILALDTSGPNCSVSIIDDSRILADFTIFVIGFIIAYFIEIANGSFDFEISKTILYILQAWGFAAVCAMNTIYLTSTELIKFKKNLKITSLAQKKISHI